MVTHPIIALWVHPRSMSTAVERIMRERGDLDCFHEPFLEDYYLHRKKATMAMLAEGEPASYEEIRDRVLRAAEKKPVFMKDMAYYVVPRIYTDDEFLQRITHTFLLRDSVQSILSYYKLDPEFTCEELGYRHQWALYQHLRDQRGLDPLVVCAEDIAQDPKTMMEIYWHYVQLDYAPHAFSWQPSMPSDWQRVAGWHDRVTASTGIVNWRNAETAHTEFRELVEKAPHLTGYLEHHRAACEGLREQATRLPK